MHAELFMENKTLWGILEEVDEGMVNTASQV